MPTLFLEAPPGSPPSATLRRGFRTGDEGFADLCLTAYNCLNRLFSYTFLVFLNTSLLSGGSLGGSSIQKTIISNHIITHFPSKSKHFSRSQNHLLASFLPSFLARLSMPYPHYYTTIQYLITIELTILISTIIMTDYYVGHGIIMSQGQRHRQPLLTKNTRRERNNHEDQLRLPRHRIDQKRSIPSKRSPFQNV